MSVQLISVLTAIVAVGVTLAGLILTATRGLRQDIKELRGEIGELRERMTHEISELRERMAKLEGLLEGLREAITGRTAVS